MLLLLQSSLQELKNKVALLTDFKKGYFSICRILHSFNVCFPIIVTHLQLSPKLLTFNYEVNTSRNMVTMYIPGKTTICLLVLGFSRSYGKNVETFMLQSKKKHVVSII